MLTVTHQYHIGELSVRLEQLEAPAPAAGREVADLRLFGACARLLDDG